MRSGQVAVVATLLVVSACGSSSSPETSSDALAVSTTAEVTEMIPSDWVTYTDETASFELSYPNAWGVLDFDDAMVREILEPLAEGSDLDLEVATNLFLAGLEQPGGVGFDPNVSITVEPLPFEMTVDEYSSASTRGAEQVYDSWETGSISKIQFGDGEAVLFHASIALSEIDPSARGDVRWWMVQLAVPKELVGWTVACGSAALTELDAQDAVSTCEDVVRSFKLHAP